jgi:hypothetical protein
MSYIELGNYVTNLPEMAKAKRLENEEKEIEKRDREKKRE